jgi:hypothetical protein
MSTSKPRDQIWAEWRELVNMSPSEIEDWLGSEESASVGDTGDERSTGRQSARRIIDIKRTRKDDLSDDQWEHMATVVGYIKRHCAQGGPKEHKEQSDWRYSLMNWGHDPIRSDGCA